RGERLTARLFAKVLAGAVCLLLVALLAVDFFGSRTAGSSYMRNLTAQLEEKCHMAALALEGTAAVEAAQVEALARASGARITVIAPDGRVLADSEAE